MSQGADSAPRQGFSSVPSLRQEVVDAQPFRAKPVPAVVRKVRPAFLIIYVCKCVLIFLRFFAEVYSSAVL